MENYNDNVTKVSEFINKEVADSLNRNYQKLESIKSGNDFIAKKLEEEKNIHTSLGGKLRQQRRIA